MVDLKNENATEDFDQGTELRRDHLITESLLRNFESPSNNFKPFNFADDDEFTIKGVIQTEDATVVTHRQDLTINNMPSL